MQSKGTAPTLDQRSVSNEAPAGAAVAAVMLTRALATPRAGIAMRTS